MGTEEKNELYKHFIVFKDQLSYAYDVNLPFEDEDDCIKWYEDRFNSIDEEENKFRNNFIDHDDKREVGFASAIAKAFLVENLMHEKYSSDDFEAFKLLKNVIY